MFCGNTRTEKLCNDLSVIVICVAKVYVRVQKAVSRRTFFCCNAPLGTYMKTYVRFIVAGDKIATEHCCVTVCLHSLHSSSATHRLYFCVSAATVVTRTCHNFSLCVHFLSCFLTTVMCIFIGFICKKWRQLNSTWQRSPCSGPQEMTILIVPGCVIPLVFLTSEWKRLKLP